MDCEPACLRMIAAFPGKTFSLQELRKRSYIDREGVSLQGINEAAESIGYRTMGVKIPFGASLLPHTYVPAGQPLLAVIPDVEGPLAVAVAGVGSTRLGRIEPGNRVLIRLDAWPYKEYGSLSAEVEHIARLPRVQGERGDTFDLRMAMALPILTTTGATLPLKPRETGVARIITRERRLLARLFDQILSLIHPNPRSA